MQANKKNLLAALEKSLGIVSTACERAKISRDTHYRWMREDDEYRLAAESIDELVLDFAESQLHKQIKENNTAATIFFLKTKGKKRGYVESILHGGDKENPLQVDIKIRIDDLTSDKPK